MMVPEGSKMVNKGFINNNPLTNDAVHAEGAVERVEATGEGGHREQQIDDDGRGGDLQGDIVAQQVEGHRGRAQVVPLHPTLLVLPRLGLRLCLRLLQPGGGLPEGLVHVDHRLEDLLLLLLVMVKICVGVKRQRFEVFAGSGHQQGLRVLVDHLGKRREGDDCWGDGGEEVKR